jgi:raffinose/stachyose/melibiose transport system substrate-binding protein
LLAVFACSLAQVSAEETFTVWHYETAALARSWSQALDLFRLAHPGVRVELKVKTFEEIRQTAADVLAADGPDVVELNKGNANAGALAAKGLLKDLTVEATRRGWDKLLPTSLQTAARYTRRGIMGSGSWYGVSSYGELVVVYYNKDLFKKYGQKVPRTLAEFETTLAAFRAAGVVPLSLGAANFPAQHLLYELYLARATRKDVDAFQNYGAAVDFQSPAWRSAASTLAAWGAAGYFGPSALELDDEGQLSQFAAGKAALLVTGSWVFPRLLEEKPGFEWGSFLFPGNRLHPGSGGNLWVIPARSAHPEWALEFIDLTLSGPVQTALANGGGIAVNADVSKVSNPRNAELLRNFRQVMGQDGLAFYPDWPAVGFYDSLVSACLDLLRGVQPNQVLGDLDLAYRTKSGRP